MTTFIKIPNQAKPKNNPPELPNNFYDKEELHRFSGEYEKWKKENDHIPGLQTAKEIIEKFRLGIENRKKEKEDKDNRLENIEKNLLKLMKHLGVK